MPDSDEGSISVEEELEQLPNRARQHLRETEKRAKALSIEAEEGRAAKRELAALRAGLDLTTGPGSLFADAYKGEWNEADVRAAMAKYGIPSVTSSGQQPGDGASDAEKAQREAERRTAMEGQQHLGETKFGDWRPEGASLQDQLIQDLREAQSKVTATDYVGSLEQGKAAMREVLHAHGMILADEVD